MKSKAIRVLAALGLLVGASACEKDFLDINEDPLNPTTTDVMLVLPAGQSHVSFIVGGQYNILGEILAQHMGSTSANGQYSNYERYNLNSSTLDGRQFQNLYAGSLNDFEYIINEGTKKNEFRLVGIAKILKAHTYQLLTDLYGDLPYSEALQPTLTKTPKYDRQQDIYAALHTLLNEGIADIKKQQGRFPGTSDMNYRAATEADMGKWTRLANTLKLRLCMRLTEVDPVGARDSTMALYRRMSDPNMEFMQPNVFSTNGGQTTTHDFLFFHVAANLSDNPFYQANSRQPNNLAVSSTIGRIMVAANDPRRLVYFMDADVSTPSTTEHSFVEPGNSRNIRYSYPGPLFIGSNFSQGSIQGRDLSFYTQFDSFARPRPTLLLTYEESQFLRAEAAVRGWAPATENVQTLYDNGVRSSVARYRTLFVNTNGALTEANSYLGQAAVSITSAVNNTPEAKLRLISTQKWLSYFGTNGMEAWTEARRTNVPTLVAPTINSLGAGRFVKRLPYPSSELQRNPSVALTGIAEGDITTPLWWDAN